MTKRALYILVLAMALALALPAMALANAGVHGNFTMDTEACAGCHRAHTSVSTITWNNGVEDRSALLVTGATTMEDFCLACHDAAGQGANTNVVEGIYESDTGDPTDPNVIGGDLNGGGFETFQGMNVSSTHVTNGSKWGAYGGGYFGQTDVDATGQIVSDPASPTATANLGETIPIVMDCATCHDTHGTSNYRLLKAEVFGNTVGGYATTGPTPENPDPQAWVQSIEEGWPNGGFRLHTDYSATYKPNYTAARYAKGYTVTGGTSGALNTARGMSAWCAGCHATYTNNSGTVADATAPYNAGDGLGFLTRHRHPVNVPMSNFMGLGDTSVIVATQQLPLAHELGEQVSGAGAPALEDSDWVECLSCHRAHGVSSTMTGWANEKADLPNDEIPSFITKSGTNVPSALLRLDERGVCQSCHNK